MTDKSARKIGMLWYGREDYPRIRSMMSDPHNLAPSYDQWLMAAENNARVAEEAGLGVVRVAITPDDFAAWCAKRGLEPDGNARMLRAREAMDGRDET
ncbi:MAG TPA: hypothetical protein VEZ16_04550 [Microvirga sp.]|nr:hypothetical protein [Microvirga sp.]